MEAAPDQIKRAGYLSNSTKTYFNPVFFFEICDNHLTAFNWFDNVIFRGHAVYKKGASHIT
jgi:hypothetical protein